MGDMAEGILNGDFDEETGEYIGPGDGYPRRMSDVPPKQVVQIPKGSLDKATFRKILKRILRQLQERIKEERSELSYQNKRKEFVNLIDKATSEPWFVFPKEGTRLWKIYYDKWD